MTIKIYTYWYFLDCHQDDCGEVIVGKNDIRCLYRTSNKLCSKIHKKRDGYTCCGPELLNTNTHKCAYNEPWAKDVHVGKCGNKTYDEAKNICCENQDGKWIQNFMLFIVSVTWEYKYPFIAVKKSFPENKIYPLSKRQVWQ